MALLDLVTSFSCLGPVNLEPKNVLIAMTAPLLLTGKRQRIQVQVGVNFKPGDKAVAVVLSITTSSCAGVLALCQLPSVSDQRCYCWRKANPFFTVSVVFEASREIR